MRFFEKVKPDGVGKIIFGKYIKNKINLDQRTSLRHAKLKEKNRYA